MKLALARIALAAAAAFGQQADSGKQPPLAKDPGAFPGVGDAEAPRQAARPPAPLAGPAPHLPDGRPDFGGKGAWFPGFAGNIAETQWKGVHSADKHVDVPFLRPALELFNHRVETVGKEDPEAQCLPVGVPRYMFDPYAFQMVQTRDRVIFLFEGDNYPWREVFLDGRAHPANVNPTWMGDAVGHYEGDALVIDVVGFNGKAWLDQAGHPQTGQQHLIERYTRVDSLTLKYEVTIDDPGAYSKPWTTSNTVRWRPGFELMENVCNENEKDSRHMLAVPDPGAGRRMRRLFVAAVLLVVPLLGQAYKSKVLSTAEAARQVREIQTKLTGTSGAGDTGLGRAQAEKDFDRLKSIVTNYVTAQIEAAPSVQWSQLRERLIQVLGIKYDGRQSDHFHEPPYVGPIFGTDGAVLLALVYGGAAGISMDAARTVVESYVIKKGNARLAGRGGSEMDGFGLDVQSADGDILVQGVLGGASGHELPAKAILYRPTQTGVSAVWQSPVLPGLHVGVFEHHLMVQYHDEERHQSGSTADTVLDVYWIDLNTGVPRLEVHTVF